jgi:hypothetical protein
MCAELCCKLTPLQCEMVPLLTLHTRGQTQLRCCVFHARMCMPQLPAPSARRSCAVSLPRCTFQHSSVGMVDRPSNKFTTAPAICLQELCCKLSSLLPQTDTASQRFNTRHVRPRPSDCHYCLHLQELCCELASLQCEQMASLLTLHTRRQAQRCVCC